MTPRIQPVVFFVFCSLYLFLFNAPSFAQTTVNQNICAQTQCVKIQNGNLWVLSSDNVTYTPYFVKAVGYEPMPVGRYPSDWGYAPTDPRSINNNIYDDPNILNRDFALLQQMNANTVRIWGGNKITVSCPCPNNGRFTNYITNAGTTANTNTAQNTLDIAASYGLKVIAGFAVSTLTFDTNNNVGSVDSNGNALGSQQIINNFVNYVNTYKGNRAILFWAIGNENNDQRLGQEPVLITTFENQIGSVNGSTIFNWLQQNNYLDFDGNIIFNVTLASFQNALQAEFANIGDNNAADYNAILNDLITDYGTSLTPQQLTAWYSLVNAMAQAAHNAEGAAFHPVAVVNGAIAEIGNSADGAADSQLPSLDIWGTNIYLGQSFGTLFSDYAAKSGKPLWIAEFGVDAWSVANAAGINDWGSTLASDLGGTGGYDPATQSTWDGDLWNEILNNSPVTIGGSVMEYSDEWWKPYEFYCTNPNDTQAANANSTSICNSNHKYFGFLKPISPDGFFNEEWWGVTSISPNSVSGDPDIISPRAAYYNLQTQWQNNPWPSLTLNMAGSGTGMISSSSSLVGGLNCNFSSGSSTGQCSALFTKNQPVILSFSSNNNSTVTNWGISGCTGGSATCNITPDANITLNVTVTAPAPVVTVSLTSPGNNAVYTAPAGITLTAGVSATNTTISNVAFYNGATLLGTATSSPYSYTWSNVAAGTYSLTAVATDSVGGTVTSSPVSVTVNAQQQSTYIITATAGSNGNIYPSGVIVVGPGGNQPFTIIPDSGYNIAGISVNGIALTGTLPTSYTFSNVNANQTISVTFAASATFSCPTNMWFNSQTNSCMCFQYAYWSGNGCSYCPEGQTSYNGSSCSPIACPANMYFDTNPSDSGYNTCKCIAGTTYTTGPGCVFTSSQVSSTESLAATPRTASGFKRNSGR